MIHSSALTLTLVTLLAYLIGGLPFGYWFVRLRFGRDIRAMGSGNIGATNVHRTSGGKAGLIVLLLDILKGLLAVAIASALTEGDPVAIALAAAAVVLGHCFPVFLRFKGGKAVACFVGAFGFISPLALLLTAIAFVIAVAASRYISLGSLIGAVLYPMFYYWVAHPPDILLYSSIFAAALIIFRHKANIARLRNGDENVFRFRGNAA